LKNKAELINHLRELFSSQSLAVLATQDRGEPYGNLVAFAATEDLKHLLFATTRATRKYNNLTKNPRIAMVIDNRSNREEDFQRAMAATAALASGARNTFPSVGPTAATGELGATCTWLPTAV